MQKKLNARERLALGHAVFHVADVFPRGVGKLTVERLVERGLLARETCPTYGTVGFKTTAEGSRLANAEMQA